MTFSKPVVFINPARIIFRRPGASDRRRSEHEDDDEYAFTMPVAVEIDPTMRSVARLVMAESDQEAIVEGGYSVVVPLTGLALGADGSQFVSDGAVRTIDDFPSSTESKSEDDGLSGGAVAGGKLNLGADRK